MNIAMILAGGLGTRTGLNCPKQFYKVNNKPIIVYTLEKFEESPSVDAIVVVCAEEWKAEVLSYKEKYRIGKMVGTAQGGASSLESAKNGLSMMDWAADDDFILIHDSVRPFIDVHVIENNIKIAHKHGVAMTAIKCVETLVYAEDGCYAEKMIPRDGLLRIQTPQTFMKGEILELLLNTDLENCKEPSAFALWMSIGRPIYCSEGNEKNIKLTYREDIDYFMKLLSN